MWPVKNMGDGGGGHWLVRMEWRPARWSVCLPPSIFHCTIKSRSFLLAPAHPGSPVKRDVKRLWCGGVPKETFRDTWHGFSLWTQPKPTVSKHWRNSKHRPQTTDSSFFTQYHIPEVRRLLPLCQFSSSSFLRDREHKMETSNIMNFQFKGSGMCNYEMGLFSRNGALLVNWPCWCYQSFFWVRVNCTWNYYSTC